MTRSIVKAPLQSESLLYISRLVKTRGPHSGLLQIAILSPPFPFDLFYWPESSPLYFVVRIISSLISPFLFIYLLSILVEVLLRLLTYRRDLVLLYLVSEDHS
jgi:hypothetical protein